MGKMGLKDKAAILIIIALIITLLVETLNYRKLINKKNIYKEVKTDTVYIGRDYSKEISKLRKAVEKMAETPPKQVIVYQPGTNTSSNTTIEKIPDSIILYISGLEKRLAVSDAYLINHPTASKLIALELSRDLFDVSVLGINGFITKSLYDMDFDIYDYTWVDNKLNHNKRKKPFKYKDPNRWKLLYINAGYDFLIQKPIMGFDYQLYFSRMKLTGYLNFTIQNTPELLGGVTLGYRLFD